MGDKECRGVTLGRTQMLPLRVPGEIFMTYQPVIGHIATLLWLNLRWAAHSGTPFSIDRAGAMGLDVQDEQVYHATECLKEYGLLEEDETGGWIVNDPLPGELFLHRYGDSRPLGGEREVGEKPHLSVESEATQTVQVQRNEGASSSRSTAVPDEAPKEKKSAQGGGAANRVMRSPLSKKRTQARMLKLVEEESNESEPVNEDMQAVVQIYHKRIGMIGPTQYEKLRFWVEEQGMQGAVVALAIEETVNSAEVPRISYLEGILRNWHNDGIRTLAHIQERKRASKVFSGSDGAAGAVKSHEGAPNAAAYQSVSSELVAKWKELYPDEYDR